MQLSNTYANAMTMVCNAIWFGLLVDTDYVMVHTQSVSTAPIRVRYRLNTDQNNIPGTCFRDDPGGDELRL